MELKKFISQSFKEIAEGVLEAQNELKHTDAIINAFDQVKLRNIEFDIATTTTNSSEKGGGLSAQVIVASIDAGGKKTKTNSSISRIKFTVPVVLPNATKVNKGEQ